VLPDGVLGGFTGYLCATSSLAYYHGSIRYVMFKVVSNCKLPTRAVGHFLLLLLLFVLALPVSHRRSS
jgi:hypothetical protein